MSEDLVRRLRIAHATVTPQVPVLALAADEIERLRKRLQICQSQDSVPLTGDVITQNERSLLAEVERLRTQLEAGSLTRPGPDTGEQAMAGEALEAQIAEDRLADARFSRWKSRKEHA